MERTEPTLVPEWLRCTGNGAGGGSSVHLSDAASSARYMRSRSLRSNNEKESRRHLERSLSSHSRRSSTNNAAKHPYGSFSRSHWDKNRDRGKEKSISEDIWEHDSSDPLASILTTRVERSALKCSQSLVSRKTGEPFPRRVENSCTSGNGVLSGGSNLNVIQKGVFEKDFPSLGTEDKQGGVRRVSSPGLSHAVQSLPVGSSGFLGGEKWTSALAEVPATLATNGTYHPPLQQNDNTSLNSSSGVSSPAGLNMAEALSQPAARVHTNPQLPDKSQRLEELAIKQSRQLIPVTPSMPKPLVPSSADKSKQSKIAVRTNETIVGPRAVHPQSHSSHLANHSRAAQTRSDSASTSHVGKFLILKPGRESVITGSKDVSCPSSDANGKVAKDPQLTMASSSPTASISVSNSVVSALESKSAALSLSPKSNADKRSSQFLAQSRSEFFNLMRRKTSPCSPPVHQDSCSDVLSPSAVEYRENFKGGHAVSPCVLENANQMICNGDRYNITENMRSLSTVGDNSLSCHGSIFPDEEEAAFLRSLGWEENGGEDEGLTEEEINSFYQEYMNRRPSLDMCQNWQPKCSSTPKLPDAASGIASSDSSSSESDADA